MSFLLHNFFQTRRWRRFFYGVILLLFLIWILPLGAFIAPSQEKLACRGQRAICLCTHVAAKGKAKTWTKSSSGTHKEEGGSSGGHNFLLITPEPLQDKNATHFFSQHSLRYSLLTVCAIEHIPKV